MTTVSDEQRERRESWVQNVRRVLTGKKRRGQAKSEEHQTSKNGDFHRQRKYCKHDEWWHQHLLYTTNAFSETELSQKKNCIFLILIRVTGLCNVRGKRRIKGEKSFKTYAT